MITFWNRKEIHISDSFERFNQVREILSVNEVPYTYKLVDRNRHDRGRRGSFGMNDQATLMYYIYVHKKDYDRAKMLID